MPNFTEPSTCKSSQRSQALELTSLFGQSQVVSWVASSQVCEAVTADRSHARSESIAVASIHARTAARSADGTAHTVSTGCGIADRGLQRSQKTGRGAAARQPWGRPFQVTEPTPGSAA